MIRKVLIIAAIIALSAIAAVFIYRYQLISYSAEAAIRSALPGYVRVSEIRFDFKENMVFLEEFKLEGPRGFSERHIIEIAQISCRYKLKGATILDGLEVYEPVLKDMVMRIERLRDARVNVSEMGGVIGDETESRPAPAGAGDGPGKSEVREGRGPKMSDFIKLPREFRINNGKIIITDRFFVRGYHEITLDNIEAVLILRMNDNYSQVLDVASSGEGNVNGHRDQIVRWNINFNPNTPRITMSSRFDVSGVDLITFEPYYDKFSPFEFARCRVSGVLIFNFDNGNIGSSNELRLSDLIFSIKPGSEKVAMFETDVRDLARYFTTISGDVVFDFKIKGDITNPRFFLGPISKQAVAAMVIDKVGDVLQQMARKGSGQAGAVASEAGNSGADKTKQIIDMVKGFLDKNK